MAVSDRVTARYLRRTEGFEKNAAFPPFPPKNEGGGVAAVRNIPKEHPFDKRALKPLSKALWASTVALGHALTAYRHLSRLKSTTVSPDGQLGGRGYVMPLGDMRKKLYEASEALSAISDTIYDEITAPHWQPKLAQLDENDREDVSRFVEEAQGVMENPEGDAEDRIEEIEGENDGKSSLPTAEDSQAEVEPLRRQNKEASVGQVDLHTKTLLSQLKRPAGWSDKRWIAYYYRTQQALYPNAAVTEYDPSKDLIGPRVAGSIPVHDLGGPRVDHIGPGEGDGLYGEFNEDSQPVDPWSADGGGVSRRDETGEDYDYTSEWENEASSVTPAEPGTGTDAWDFGLGYGARGDGAGDYRNPSGEGDGSKGVYGPQSGLPGAPAQSSGDMVPPMDPRQAEVFSELYGAGKLPQDVAGLPSRSDYYPGLKDNLVSPMATSTLPEPAEALHEDMGGLLNTHQVIEDTNTPYVRYDYTTHTMREPGGDHPGQEHQEPWAPDGESTR